MNAVPQVATQDTVLVADKLTRHYSVKRSMFAQGTVKALNGVSFSLQRGKTLAVVGESGCGKSTLARQLTMIEAPTSGRLLIDGEDVADANRAKIADLRQRVQMVFQNPFASLNPRKTVEQTLGEPLAINTKLSANERARADCAHDAHRRFAAGTCGAVSAHVLGRSAAACGDRACDDSRPADSRRR